MKILIAGTGGVGGYYGARLAAKGNEVWFVSRGERLRILRERGLHVRSDHGDVELPQVRAIDNGAQAAGADAVLFCVKVYDNESAAETIAPAVMAGTSITSLQNGVENEIFLSRRFPGAAILGGVARIEAWWESTGVIVQRGPQTGVVAGPFRPEDRPAAEALAAAFDGTGVPFTVSDDIESALWYKLMSICAVGGVTAYCRCPIGAARSDERLRALLVSVLHEVGAVAAARGIALPPDPEDTLLRYFDRSLDPGFQSSMCRDVLAGRPLEVEWLNGAVVRFGDELGIPTPTNREIYDELIPLHRRAMDARSAPR